MRIKLFKILTFSAIMALLLSVFLTVPSRAQTSGISVDFAAAQPTTYGHKSGGGIWNSGIVNTDIARSLEGEQFACNDTVSFLTKISVGNSQALRDQGHMTLQFDYSFTLDATGQSGVALTGPLAVSVNGDWDSATKGDTSSVATLVSSTPTGTKFTKGAELLAKVNVNDVEANEVIVLRIDANIECAPNAHPTGNLQAKLLDGFLILKSENTPISPAEDLGTGAKTIDLKTVNNISTPQLVIQKTVTTATGTCPGGENLTITPNQTVKYCYVVTNPSNSGGKLGAPLYNVSIINDDGGQYSDFTVTLTSGLTDLDSDGVADDLAAGAVATGWATKTFDGDQDSTIMNTAVISGKDAPTGGNTLNASDTATVFVDAPDPAPSITITKTPASQTVFDGYTASFTISVHNTGNVTLTNVLVTDTATPTCNNSWTSLAADATRSYTCTSSVLLAPFTNIAVVVGNYQTTQVTDTASAIILMDFLPKIEVTKSVSHATLPETGGYETFTVVVKNKAVEAFTLNSLVDSIFGNLAGVGTCSVPQTIDVSGQYSCSFTKPLASDSLLPHIDTVTATGTDPQQNQTSASGSARVDFTDVLPDISLDKSVNLASVPKTGDQVNYHFVITNLTLETVTISSFSDTLVTLSSGCLGLIGQKLSPLGTLECYVNNFPIPVAPGNTFTNTATVIAQDNEGNSDSASDSAVVDVPAVPSISILKNPETQTVFDGTSASFTITVHNTGNVTLTDVVVTDTATTSCNNSWSSLAPDASQVYTCATGLLYAPFTNIASVVGNYQSTQVSDQDSAIVYMDYLPKIEVTKTPSIASLPETGGYETFTVVVKNKAIELFTLTSLVDSVFGNLAGVGTCVVPQTIAVDGQYSCAFTKRIASDSLVPHFDTVTATGTDPQQNQTSASGSAKVNFTDVLPHIALTKTVNPTVIRWTGDYVDYQFTISNLTLETVTITSFVDTQVTLSGQCLGLITQTIAPLSSLSCSILHYPLTGVANGSFTNTAWVTAQDNESNMDTATASATVKFWWYGRTPGYWKNHPEAWISGYTTGMKVQEIFAIPETLTVSVGLDLDKNGVKDTLLAGLAFKGGSDLGGAAQIMLRAAIAALLNKAYYGVYYPAATSTSDLITMVNNALKTMDRAKFLELGSYFDYWNNGKETSLP